MQMHSVLVVQLPLLTFVIYLVGKIVWYIVYLGGNIGVLGRGLNTSVGSQNGQPPWQPRYFLQNSS